MEHLGRPAEHIPEHAAPTLVRPYALTGGRTRSRVQIAMEALLVSTNRSELDAAALTHDWRRVVELCQQVQSLAEVGAYLGVPLGVARVIVGDMAEMGLVDVHEPGRLDDQIGTFLLERVLSGLRKL
jgi:hypothetical protein